MKNGQVSKENERKMANRHQPQCVIGNSVKPKHRGLPAYSGVSIFLELFFAVNQKNGDHKTWTHH